MLYRWLNPSLPFHVFVVWYDCLISSLSLFAIFFLARALWRSDGAGVFASVLYAALYPSYGRTVKNLFLREDFAIPLILFALFFTVRAMQGRSGVSSDPAVGIDRRNARPTCQILAAVFWLAALASWHLTQFVMLPLMIAVALVYLGTGETPRLSWLVLLLTAGALFIPVLWAKQFYLSPTMCLLYALSLAVWINGGRKRATIVFASWAGGVSRSGRAAAEILWRICARLPTLPLQTAFSGRETGRSCGVTVGGTRALGRRVQHGGVGRILAKPDVDAGRSGSFASCK